jgi:molybdate transport system substrate-binding protein
MFNKTLLWAAGCLMALTAAVSADAEPSKEIMVSAAISLKNAFEEIGCRYESKNAGVKVVFNFGASGDLARQIEGGAPVDVFASAAQKEMDQIDMKGLIDRSTRINFVKNTVVLIQSPASPFEIKGFEDLLALGIKMISIGNPQTVPAGKYAQEVFKHFSIWEGIVGKLILAENVRQVLDYVTKNEVDAGVVYATDAAVQSGKIKIVATAPPGSHNPIVYPAAAMKDSKNVAMAKVFIALLTSETGMHILKKHGFESAP